MKQLKYTGTGRGQGFRIVVNGYQFIRGEVTPVDDDAVAARLSKRDGFELVKPKRGKVANNGRSNSQGD